MIEIFVHHLRAPFAPFTHYLCILGIVVLGFYGCNREKPSVECIDHDDCALGWLCVNSICKEVCNYDSDCVSSGEVCKNGLCQPGERDACDGVICDDPPASSCGGDGLTRFFYASPGTCNSGICQYSPYSQICPKGCEDGGCIGAECAKGSECPAGYYCQKFDQTCQSLLECKIRNESDFGHSNAAEGLECGDYIDYCYDVSTCDSRKHKHSCSSGSCTGSWVADADSSAGVCSGQVCSNTVYCYDSCTIYNGKTCGAAEGSCSVAYGYVGPCAIGWKCSEGICCVADTCADFSSICDMTGTYATCGGVCTRGDTDGVSCGIDNTCCQGSCIDSQTDSGNCGGCGIPCDDWQTCVGGFCKEAMIQIDGGGRHMCALRVDGKVFCWGCNGDGQLGDNTTTDRHLPVEVLGLSDVVSIGIGEDHSCAVLEDGTARCWGRNSGGILGDGTWLDRHTPVIVDGLSNAISIEANRVHTCAVLDNGTAYCWGRNHDGQLGDGTGINRYTPVIVDGLSNAISIRPGHDHTCALLQDGTVKCWGDNHEGQLGDGTFIGRSKPGPVVSGLSNVVSLGVGMDHSCAVSGGETWCWGDNDLGQLGDGTINKSSTPVKVSGMINAVSVVGGRRHSCALLSDSTIQCWGCNSNGRLGDGTTTDRFTPVAVLGVSDAAVIGLGWIHTCEIDSDGIAKCWGGNADGQLGDGTSTDRYTFVEVEF